MPAFGTGTGQTRYQEISARLRSKDNKSDLSDLSTGKVSQAKLSDNSSKFRLLQLKLRKNVDEEHSFFLRIPIARALSKTKSNSTNRWKIEEEY